MGSSQNAVRLQFSFYRYFDLKNAKSSKIQTVKEQIGLGLMLLIGVAVLFIVGLIYCRLLVWLMRWTLPSASGVTMRQTGDAVNILSVELN